MVVSRNKRTKKQQLGQFMTPESVSRAIVDDLDPEVSDTFLEPSFGKGSFIKEYIDYLIDKENPENVTDFVTDLLESKIFGVEYDEELYQYTIANLRSVYSLPEGFSHNLVRSDFFDFNTDDKQLFDHILGNPPFGGTFTHPEIDRLDRKYGVWNGYKIKKETYAFFVSKSLNMLSEKGTLTFILSDTFLTIKTMEGLRRYISNTGKTSVKAINFMSEETQWEMVVLSVKKGQPDQNDNLITINGQQLLTEWIESTPNYSWGINKETLKFFNSQVLLNEYLVASSGMTIGKNELYVRPVVNGKFHEPYEFTFGTRLVTVEEELSKARLNKISPAKLKAIQDSEAKGETFTVPIFTERPDVLELEYTDNLADYKPYNKADTKEKYFTHVKNVVFWKDDGKHLLLYKKTGPWYLHGVGGLKFFQKEGITWPLISSSIKAKYLKAGFILDSGAPVAVLKSGVDHEELYFILGWLWTEEATFLLKTALNHTRNIQSKDIERLPYPVWVPVEVKKKIIAHVKSILEKAEHSLIEEADKEFKSVQDLFSKNNPSAP